MVKARRRSRKAPQDSDLEDNSLLISLANKARIRLTPADGFYPDILPSKVVELLNAAETNRVTKRQIAHLRYTAFAALSVRKPESAKAFYNTLTVLIGLQDETWVWMRPVVARDSAELSPAHVADIQVKSYPSGSNLVLIVTAYQDGRLVYSTYEWQAKHIGFDSVSVLLHRFRLSLKLQADVDISQQHAEYNAAISTVGARVLLTGYAFGGIDDSYYTDRTSSLNGLDPIRRDTAVVAVQEADGVIDVQHELVGSGETSELCNPFSFWERHYLRRRENQGLRCQQYVEAARQQLYIDWRIPPVSYVPVMVFPIHQRCLVRITDITFVGSSRDISLDDLALEDDVREIVDVLGRSRPKEFKDLVAGKSQNSNVLLVGPPGVGKTLICEHLASRAKQALYVVRASTLGFDIPELSRRLDLIERRAIRWSAVILLDDADPYISCRGSDLQQVAVVGEVLRFLERNQTQVFITSNQDKIDSAIIPRCFVTLRLGIPERWARVAIWKKIAKANKVKVPVAVIRQVCNDEWSGRELLQLIKLIARVYGDAGNETESITYEMISRLFRFIKL